MVMADVADPVMVKVCNEQSSAFIYLLWLSDDDKYVRPMGSRVGRFPAKTWLQTSPEYTENLSLIPFFKQLDDAQPYRLGLFPEAEEAFNNAVKAVFYFKFGS